jgi:hypothetical protein
MVRSEANYLNISSQLKSIATSFLLIHKRESYKWHKYFPTIHKFNQILLRQKSLQI